MKKTTILLCIVTFISGCAHPTLLKVKVTDSNSEAVGNAQVTVGWEWNYDPSGMTGPSTRKKTGTADGAGNYTFVRMTKGSLGVSASKDGYYWTYCNIIKNHQVIVRMRKKHNPSAMYAKIAKLDLPSGNGSFGYDLFAGDLVAPLGAGTITDLVFRVETTSTNWRGRVIYRLHGDIGFPQKGDGIQAFFVPNRIQPRSEYRLPFEAPESGYSRTLVSADGTTQARYQAFGGQREQTNSLPRLWYWTDDYQFTDPSRYWIEEVNYFFRVRSREDGNACFGLIRGMVRFMYRGEQIPHIEFSYYVNPDGSRNIEYDPRKNLMHKFGRYSLHEYSPAYP